MKVFKQTLLGLSALRLLIALGFIGCTGERIRDRSRPSDDFEEVPGYLNEATVEVLPGEAGNVSLGDVKVDVREGTSDKKIRITLRRNPAENPITQDEMIALGTPLGDPIQIQVVDADTLKPIERSDLLAPFDFSQLVKSPGNQAATKALLIDDAGLPTQFKSFVKSEELTFNSEFDRLSLELVGAKTLVGFPVVAVNTIAVFVESDASAPSEMGSEFSIPRENSIFSAGNGTGTGSGSSSGGSGSSTGNGESAPQPLTTWRWVDGGSSNGINYNPLLTASSPKLIEFNSKLYACWIEVDGASIPNLRVAVFNGNDASPSWTSVNEGGDGLNANVQYPAYSCSMAVHQGKLYVSWNEEGAGGASRVSYVRVYNGNDMFPGWSAAVSTVGLTNNDSGHRGQRLIGHSGNLFSYISQYNSSTYDFFTARFNNNESSPNWPSAGSINSLNDFPTVGTEFEMVSFGGKLYGFFDSAGSSPGGGWGIRTIQHNGNFSSPAWVWKDSGVGISLPSGKEAVDASPFVFGGKMYLAFLATAEPVPSQYQSGVGVVAYNGNDSSPEWQSVVGSATYGIRYASTGSPQISNQMLVSANGVLYLTFRESNKIRVAAYNGNSTSPSWSLVDGGTSAGLNFDLDRTVTKPFAVAFNNRLYLVWSEQKGVGGPFQIRVAVGN